VNSSSKYFAQKSKHVKKIEESLGTGSMSGIEIFGAVSVGAPWSPV
jgi:hypothetical protein